MANVKYLGHSGFFLTVGDRLILIDPFTGKGGKERPLVNLVFDQAPVKELDFIFLTHEHYDHCEPETVEVLAERTYAQVVAPAPALAKLNISDRLKVDVRTGDTFTLKGVGVEVVKAVHPQSLYPVGYVISYEGKSIYHAGDTYSWTGMNKLKAELALLPIGGTRTMDAFAAAEACKEFKPKFAVPMHYNTYNSIRQDPQEFVRHVGPHTKPIVLRPGEGFDF